MGIELKIDRWERNRRKRKGWERREDRKVRGEEKIGRGTDQKKRLYPFNLE